METINVHEAKTHLSRLLERAAGGDEIVIARAGRPVARLVPMGKTESTPRRLGILAGKRSVPDDIDTPFATEIETMFYRRSEEDR